MTRIEKLKVHLKSRRGRRDFQALHRLVELKDGVKRGARLRSVDAFLKCYYNETEAALASYKEKHPFFALIAKDECPPDRIYGVAARLKDG